MKQYDKAVEICAKNLMLSEVFPQRKQDFLAENESIKATWGITDQEIYDAKDKLDTSKILQNLRQT